MGHTRHSTCRARRRLTLEPRDGLIAGVCAGVARYLRTDVAIVRITTLVAGLFLPKIVLAAYLIAWFVLDRRDERFE